LTNLPVGSFCEVGPQNFFGFFGAAAWAPAQRADPNRAASLHRISNIFSSAFEAVKEKLWRRSSPMPASVALSLATSIFHESWARAGPSPHQACRGPESAWRAISRQLRAESNQKCDAS